MYNVLLLTVASHAVYKINLLLESQVMLTPSVSFRRGKQLVGNVAILFSGPSQKLPKVNSYSQSQVNSEQQGNKMHTIHPWIQRLMGRINTCEL